MNWIYLLIAGILEIGWPLGFKLSSMQDGEDGLLSRKILFIALSAVCMSASGFFLWLAQKTIPIGTAYAIWTGIGAIGAFLIGIVFFRESAAPARLVAAFLLIAGIIGLKLTSAPA